jgi:peroxiredoxin
LADKYSAKGYKIYGASRDSVEANAAFATKFDFTFPLLSDADASLTKAFDACKDEGCSMSDRMTVVVDEAGNVEQYLKPFDKTEGPQTLLDSL